MAVKAIKINFWRGNVTYSRSTLTMLLLFAASLLLPVQGWLLSFNIILLDSPVYEKSQNTPFCERG